MYHLALLDCATEPKLPVKKNKITVYWLFFSKIAKKEPAFLFLGNYRLLQYTWLWRFRLTVIDIIRESWLIVKVILLQRSMSPHFSVANVMCLAPN